MRRILKLRSLTLALLATACSSGADIASPGATNTGNTGGGTGGNTGGGSGTPTASCPTGTTVAGTVTATTSQRTFTVCDIAGEVLADLSLPFDANIVYHISGRVDIGRDTGADGAAANGRSATLTIAPGVRLFGAAAGDLLIVNRGSRINAVGTTNNPIIFTSRQDIQELNDPTTASRQWGGVILLGNAPIRGCNQNVVTGSATCEDEVEGVTNATGRVALFGGANPASNSGTMQFVQIRFPGAFLTTAAAGDDLNGLTLGGTGSGTTLDHIQIHNSGDDGIEVFGGTTNIRYLVLTGETDDSLDCDYGWTGAAQFVVVAQTSVAGSGGPDGLVECSNANRLSSSGSLLTRPVITNFTFVGVPVSSGGSPLKGIAFDSAGSTPGTPGASGRLFNGVVTGSTRCLSVEPPDTTGTRGTANTTTPPTANSVIFDCPGWVPSTFAAQIVNAGTNNSINVANTLRNRFFPGTVETARTPVATGSIGVSFLQTADYVGAFSPTETLASNWAAGWTFNFLPTSSCPAGTTQATPLATASGSRTRCILSGVLGQNGVPASVRLTPGNIYEISGRVDVGVDRGGAGTGGVAGSLTIDPGVTLFGNDAGDLLIINRGSTIVANGSVSQPIIMTSQADLQRTTPDSTANREWGGLILLGRAPIRGCSQAVQQGTVTCEDEVEGVTNATGRVALFGGATAADTSGSIRFMQIRYPGAFLTTAAAGDDLNGLTLGGVGSGTTLDHIQIHNSGDDGVEVFGGTVNMRYFILTGALDDSLDCDYGWTGNVQFVLTIQHLLTGGPDGLVECSNANRLSTTATPGVSTRPVISNVTFVGIPLNAGGSPLKGVAFDSAGSTPGTLGASGRLFNGVVVGASRCLSVEPPDTTGTRGTANTTTPPSADSVLFDCPGWTPSTFAAQIIGAGANNSTATTNTLQVPSAPAVAPTAAYPIRFVNGTTETARTAVDPTTLGAFFMSGTYVGAVRDQNDNWWRGWSCGLEQPTC